MGDKTEDINEQLKEAVFSGNKELARKLLAAGADLNTPHGGEASLLISAACDEKVDAVRLLVELGADVNFRTAYSSPAINHCCLNVETTRLLLAAGADIDDTSRDGDCALAWAANAGELEYVKLAVEAGADVNGRERERYNWTPLIAASMLDERRSPMAMGEIGRLDYAYRPVHEKIVELLIQAGANLDAQDDRGCTALHCASTFGNHRIVQMLLDAGADPEIASTEGETPLAAALSFGHATVAGTLLAAGAKPSGATGWAISVRDPVFQLRSFMVPQADRHRLYGWHIPVRNVNKFIWQHRLEELESWKRLSGMLEHHLTE